MREGRRLPLIAVAAISVVSSTAFASTTIVIKGTAQADHIAGTAANDRIYGLGGDDDLRGRGGADVIYGGPGNDRLRGEQGRDELVGGGGDDQIYGVYGDDFVCGLGFDWLFVARVPVDVRATYLIDIISSRAAHCERVRFTG